MPILNHGGLGPVIDVQVCIEATKAGCISVGGGNISCVTLCKLGWCYAGYHMLHGEAVVLDRAWYGRETGTVTTCAEARWLRWC